MGTCICGGDDQVTHSHHSGRGVAITVPAVSPGIIGYPILAEPLAPVYATHWRPWCAACAAAAAKAGLFLFGAQCLHQTPFINPV